MLPVALTHMTFLPLLVSQVATSGPLSTGLPGWHLPWRAFEGAGLDLDCSNNRIHQTPWRKASAGLAFLFAVADALGAAGRQPGISQSGCPRTSVLNQRPVPACRYRSGQGQPAQSEGSRRGDDAPAVPLAATTPAALPRFYRNKRQIAHRFFPAQQ